MNYYTEEEAERAASVKQGYKMSGVAIKTKGPKLLSQQGHFSASPPRPDVPSPTGLNFRPLTDCSFFVLGKKCKKAGSVSIQCIRFVNVIKVFRGWPHPLSQVVKFAYYNYMQFTVCYVIPRAFGSSYHSDRNFNP